MSSLLFYTNPMSRGRMAHWMLEETGVPYETHVLNLKKGEHKTPEFLRINPMGKVPVIVHNGVIVTETPAICAYLADAFPESGLAPALNSPLRGTYLRWMFFAAGCIEPAVFDKMLNRTYEHKGQVGHGGYNETMDALEGALQPGPYILGERFSAADVYIASQLGWGMMMKAIDARPVFQQYVARCTDRPAHRRFVEQCKKLESL